MEKKGRFIIKKRGVTGCILLAAGFALLFSAKLFQGFADWYSTHLYQLWVSTVSRIMNLIPFSVAEFLIYIVIIGILGTGTWLVIRLILKKAGRKEVLSWGTNLLLLVSVLFFLYVVNCGINYNRDSFSETSSITVEEYTVEELEEVCRWLTAEMNQLASEVKRDEDGIMLKPDFLQDEAVNSMEALGKEYPELSGYYSKPKGLAFPWVLSIQYLSGIYLPFTVEANYNTAMTDYNIPFVACHELSHLRGFMQEEEANFIAFLACIQSDETAFRYSGYVSGWNYCMNVLYKADYKAWEEIRGELAIAVEPDLKANREFWAEYDGRIAEVANQINDTYLKANGQDNGVKSYNQMVDLIVAYYYQ